MFHSYESRSSPSNLEALIDVRQIGPADAFELKSSSVRDAILLSITQTHLTEAITVYISTRKTKQLPLAIQTKETPTLSLDVPLLKDDEVRITASDQVCLVIHATASADDIQVDSSMEVPPRLLPAVLKIKLDDVVDYTVEMLKSDGTVVLHERRYYNAKVRYVDPEINAALIGCAMGGSVKAAVSDKARDSFKFFLNKGEDLQMASLFLFLLPDSSCPAAELGD
ncbi:hypothetical protein CF326_g8087 [Tilletia indica]|nr:hypothetical protein CF326_g8087 [Tilletia indica]